MSTQVLNFTFHGIGEPPAALGVAERDVWVSRTEFLSALDAICAREDARVSFDDGNKSDIAIGLPALLERGMTGCFFVVAERIGAPGYLSAAHLRTLREAGMRIGLHGMRHRPWRGLADDDLDEEILGARQVLEGETGASISAAACPFGSYDRRVLRRLRGAGFERVFSSDGGRASSEAWLQPRNTLRAGTGAADVDGIATAGGPGASIRRAKTLVKRLR
ncbi:MAG: polysaccharide deacetylase family protein [Solirubrobacterales bacterium]